VGDITPQELGVLLDSNLGGLPRKFKPDALVSEIAIPMTPSQIVIDSAIPQTMVVFGTNGIKRSDHDYYAAYEMNYILGGSGLNSRLIDQLREKRGLAYSASTQLEPMAHSAVWQGGFSTRNEKVGTALQVMRQTLNDFSATGPTDAELADAKKYLTGSFVLSLDSNSAIASFLINMQVYNLGRDYLNKRNKLMEAVTKDQVKAMAKRLADPSKLQVVMVGRPKLEVEK